MNLKNILYLMYLCGMVGQKNDALAERNNIIQFVPPKNMQNYPNQASVNVRFDKDSNVSDFYNYMNQYTKTPIISILIDANSSEENAKISDELLPLVDGNLLTREKFTSEYGANWNNVGKESIIFSKYDSRNTISSTQLVNPQHGLYIDIPTNHTESYSSNQNTKSEDKKEDKEQKSGYQAIFVPHWITVGINIACYAMIGALSSGLKQVSKGNKYYEQLPEDLKSVMLMLPKSFLTAHPDLDPAYKLVVTAAEAFTKSVLSSKSKVTSELVLQACFNAYVETVNKACLNETIKPLSKEVSKMLGTTKLIDDKTNDFKDLIHVIFPYCKDNKIVSFIIKNTNKTIHKHVSKQILSPEITESKVMSVQALPLEILRKSGVRIPSIQEVSTPLTVSIKNKLNGKKIIF